MPNLENLKEKPFTNFTKPHERLINARRNEVFYRDDIKSLFGYSLVGIAISLAVAGVVYVVETIPNSELDPVAKFNQRQAKTEQINHAKSTVNSPSN
ncbi:6805_t:CDS:2 [Funneliformis geosporum]|uniref:6805_t:CDS:1 n=1 Tax=Funneliformis geosporum TaxID=1117311 RepID=A0A9W4WPP2_9GLOM|nr:6805_t:CDS:2 [Funneliformis geosporum]